MIRTDCLRYQFFSKSPILKHAVMKLDEEIYSRLLHNGVFNDVIVYENQQLFRREDDPIVDATEIDDLFIAILEGGRQCIWISENLAHTLRISNTDVRLVDAYVRIRFFSVNVDAERGYVDIKAIVYPKSHIPIVMHHRPCKIDLHLRRLWAKLKFLVKGG